MSEDRTPYSTMDKDIIIETAVKYFGMKWLALLCYLVEDVQQGRLEIIIQDGHVQKIGFVRWYK